MSIYIFEPSGGGGSTPTLQQVLNAGNSMTGNNQIIGNGYDLEFTAGHYFFGSQSNDFYFDFFIDTGNNNTLFKGYDNGTPTGISLNLKDKLFSFGDFINNNFFSIDGASGFTNFQASGQIAFNSNSFIDFTTDIYTFNEYTTGGGILAFVGTGFEATSHGATASVHLKIRLNGNPYVIQLKNP